jgi:hypothetical protein
MLGRSLLSFPQRFWPWAVLAAFLGVAVWHDVDFSEVADPEFPGVVRPFFNRRPPAAYRLAEPGDTLDRVALYASSVSLGIALVALSARWRARSELALWPSALAISVAAAWHASTPAPSFDGWHGLGWRVIADSSAPAWLRMVLLGCGLSLLGVITLDGVRLWPERWNLLDEAKRRGNLRLLAASFVLILLRQAEIPGVEPVGYWPRCSFVIGMVGFGLVLVRSSPFLGQAGWVRPTFRLALASAVTIATGIGVTIYHRPLARLHAVVPGRIYISAMPTYAGLAIEQDRLHFRTIINLFDEASTQASPRHAEEIRFVRDHGLRYLGSPSDGMESDRFLDETLALAQDPTAWPILVHCHGCMDRSPAWMGIYRFLVQGRPLDAIFREIEAHRGSRPKAIVTLQYNRKLQPRVPEKYAADPTGRLLIECGAGVPDPFQDPLWNRTATPGKSVVTRIEPSPRIR